jgi:PAS domain S-box-containing protein
MNLLAIASLTASVICLGLGIVVLALNRKPLLNKIFFLMTLAGFIYAFTIVLMWTAPNYETAYVWHKAGTMWPLFVALVLNFALVYTQSKWIKNKLNYSLIYVPAVMLFLISLCTEEITAPPVLKYWGYNDLPGGTWLFAVSVVWSAVIPLVAFLLCAKYYYKAKDLTQKQSGKLVMIGFAIPIIIYILTNVFAPAIKLDIPNIGIFSTLFCIIFVGYAIHEYELFEIDGSLASENIVNTIPDALVITDIEGYILQVNDNFINRSGYNQEELIGQSITKFCTDTEKYTKIMEKIKTTGMIRDQELVIQIKSGEKRIVLFSGSLILGRSAKPIGLTCVVHDITERKNMEERLVKAERLASIGELAGQLGHDLRNPLAGMKNSIFLLRKKGGQLTDFQRAEFLDILDRAVEDSNRIVTSLIDYSSELRLYYEECSLRDLVSKALGKVEVPNRIQLRVDAEDVTLNMDVSRMESVLTGIVQNAVQAIPQEGTIQVIAASEKGKVTLSVIDSGEGISEAVQAKIFTPLVTTKAKGMGMSLAIFKRIVEAHGGRITIQSEKGTGTKVKIILSIENDQVLG